MNQINTEAIYNYGNAHLFSFGPGNHAHGCCRSIEDTGTTLPLVLHPIHKRKKDILVLEPDLISM